MKCEFEIFAREIFQQTSCVCDAVAVDKIKDYYFCYEHHELITGLIVLE